MCCVRFSSTCVVSRPSLCLVGDAGVTGEGPRAGVQAAVSGKDEPLERLGPFDSSAPEWTHQAVT